MTPVATGRVLVTGATGFIGPHVCRALAERGYQVRGLVRRPGAALPPGTEAATVPDLGDRAALARALDGVDAVVHLAGRAHVLDDRAADRLTEFRRANLEGTRAVLDAALAAGARSFAFVSSVKAVGEATGEEPWTDATPPAPADPYGLSKLEAERLVRSAAERHGLHAPILRPPLVYGPGMKANALQLFGAVARGIPLPLGRIANRRSVLYVGNLAAALAAVLAADGAARETFFVTDGRDVSPAELAGAMGAALGRRARLLPVGPGALRAAGRAGDLVARFGPRLFTSDAAARLAESLVVDASRLGRVTGFRPPYSLEQGLAITAAWYRGGRREPAW